MALYLGNNKVSMKSGYTTTTGIKDFLEHGGRFSYTNYTDLTGILKYEDTENVINMNYLFSNCTNMITIPEINTSKVTNMSYMFYKCEALSSIPQLDTSNVTNMMSIFYDCISLTTIPQLDASKVTSMYNIFNGCSNLTEIHMIGMKEDFKISSSTKFTREALLEIINNLATVTTTKTLTMGSTNLAKLTDEDKAIATNKGWTLA